jgi:hypothetical protein
MGSATQRPTGFGHINAVIRYGRLAVSRIKVEQRPAVLREFKDGNAKPFAFSVMQQIVQRVRKATGEVDYVEALVH